MTQRICIDGEQVLCCAAVLFALSSLCILACSTPDQESTAADFLADSPLQLPTLKAFTPPEYERDVARNPLAQIGARLFFDPRLSPSGTQSCGTCHQPQHGFSSDGLIFESEIPSLLNIAFSQHISDLNNLTRRIRVAIENDAGWTQSLDAVVDRLRRESTYDELFAEHAQTDGLSGKAILHALTAFISRLVSSDSPFDRYLLGDRDELTPLARQGLELFTGRAGCVNCHHGPLLTDGKLHRICIGHMRTNATRTSSLRDITRTSRYFHDGSVSSLGEAVRLHGSRCQAQAPGLRTVLPDEQLPLEAFIHSLEGAQVQYYPIRLPRRKRVEQDLSEEMDRIDLLMRKNLSSMQEAVHGLSAASLTVTEWVRITAASHRIRAISERLPSLFPPQHLHDLSQYYRYASKLAESASALAEAAHEQDFDAAFEALSALNTTCNGCHETYRPFRSDQARSVNMQLRQ